MLASKGLMASSAVEPIYVDDVFSTYLYTGNGSTQTITNGIGLGNGFVDPYQFTATISNFNLVAIDRVGDYLIAIGSSPATGEPLYYRSSDVGSTWISFSLPEGAGNIITSVVFFNGRAFIGNNGGLYSSSVAPYSSWSLVLDNIGTPTVKVVNNKLMVMTNPSSGVTLRYSDNGVSFTTSATVVGFYIFLDVTYGDGYYYASSVDITFSNVGKVKRSANLSTWTDMITVSGFSYETRVAYGNGRLVLVGGAGVTTGRVYYSTNQGVDFSFTSTGIDFRSVFFSDNYFFAGNRISSDATNWGTEISPSVKLSGNTLFYLTGTSSALVSNGLFFGEGGLVWIKSRSLAFGHSLFDTVRGSSSGDSNRLVTNSTAAEQGSNEDWLTFNANGFNANNDPGGGIITNNGTTYVSWTFRKAPKFFDVVTYTGNGANRTVAHNLGSVPGMILVKRTDTTADWQVYHRSLANTQYMVLNTTAAAATGATRWNSTTPTSSVFSLGTDATVNASGGTYVAYLFAHDASGFGESGTDSAVSCGSYTGNFNNNGPEVNLGWEPQYVLIKSASGAYPWSLFDNMRGLAYTQQALLRPNSADAEISLTNWIVPTATGFKITQADNDINTNAATYIYMAIRRPNKPPTVGTSVFSPVARTGTGANATVSSGFVTDTVIEGNRTGTLLGTKFGAWNRLRGTGYNFTNTTAAEVAAAATIIQANPWDVMAGYKVGTTSTLTNTSGNTFINWMFKRAPGFHDVVCYTGTGVARTVAHNLTVAPELMIVKKRSATDNWVVYAGDATDYLILNSTAATADLDTMWNDTAPTSSVFSLGTNDDVNGSGATFVAYLFATLPGISKVGSYTGTGTTQQINCGFTTGARFVLIKRTDSTGDWYVWDTARGIIAGNDPYLLLNSTAAEVTNTDYIDPLASGFEISSTAPAAINASGGSYIFLAIA
jgi:hypothetical protein